MLLLPCTGPVGCGLVKSTPASPGRGRGWPRAKRRLPARTLHQARSACTRNATGGARGAARTTRTRVPARPGRRTARARPTLLLPLTSVVHTSEDRWDLSWTCRRPGQFYRVTQCHRGDVAPHAGFFRPGPADGLQPEAGDLRSPQFPLARPPVERRGWIATQMIKEAGQAGPEVQQGSLSGTGVVVPSLRCSFRFPVANGRLVGVHLLGASVSLILRGRSLRPLTFLGLMGILGAVLIAHPHSSVGVNGTPSPHSSSRATWLAAPFGRHFDRERQSGGREIRGA